MKVKIGWGMLGFLVFLLVCGLSVPLGLVVAWWASIAFVGGVILLVAFIALAIRLTESQYSERSRL